MSFLNPRLSVSRRFLIFPTTIAYHHNYDNKPNSKQISPLHLFNTIRLTHPPLSALITPAPLDLLDGADKLIFSNVYKVFCLNRPMLGL